jgi:hypothetical protein
MSPDAACHDLLIRLAGRLPDELLWRMRDWLADGGRGVLGATLPRELLRHRVGLTDAERDLLEVAVGEWDTANRLLDAVLPALEPDELNVTFRPVPGGGDIDAAALSVLAVVRSHPGCVELRQGWRQSPGAPDQRVVLVLGGEWPWTLAGTLQRLLRAHGDRTPCVEVLPPHGEPPAYHRAAIIGSAPLWRSAAALADA